MGQAASSSTCREHLGRLMGFVLSIALTGVLLSVVVKPWVGFSWWKTFRRCVSIAAGLMVWVFVHHVEGRSLRSLGLGAWLFGKRQLAQGVLLGFGAALLVGSLYLASGACHIAVNPDTLRVWVTLLGFLPAAGLLATLEELIFRGYVLQHLLSCSKPLALIGSSTAYALVHLRTTLCWTGSVFELTGLFLLGWVLALSVLRTRQLYLAIGLHASLAYCAIVNKLLVEFPGPALQWLVGSNRLVNGVVAWIVLLGIGRIVTRWGSSPQSASPV